MRRTFPSPEPTMLQRCRDSGSAIPQITHLRSPRNTSRLFNTALDAAMSGRPDPVSTLLRESSGGGEIGEEGICNLIGVNYMR